MARFDFGGTLADFVVTSRRLGGLDTLALSSATLTFWSAQSGGTKYTDLVLNGSAVSSIAVASDGQVPKFQGPDGVTEMWVDGGSPRVRVVTLQGAPGPAGPTGPVSTVPGPTGATGPTGPQGIPGVNGVANDTATAGQISTPGTATDAALKASYTQLTSVATTATASATLTANRHTPVDATSAVRTMTLPSASPGSLLSVEKTDASTNAVNVTGTLRGVASSTIALTSQYDARTFLSEGGGSWRPVSDHRTATSLSATIAAQAVAKRSQVFSVADEGALAGSGNAAATSAAFAAAFTKAAAVGGEVFIPPLAPGQGYYFNSDLNCPAGVSLRGAGSVSSGGSLLIFNGCSLVASSVDYADWHNFTVQRIGTAGPAIVASGGAGGFRRIFWDNVNIQGSTGEGAVLSGGWVMTWVNPIVRNCAGGGVVTTTGAFVTGMNSLTLVGGEIGGNGTGLILDRVKQCNIVGTAIEGNTGLGISTGLSVRSLSVLGYFEANGGGHIGFASYNGGLVGRVTTAVIRGGSYFLRPSGGADLAVTFSPGSEAVFIEDGVAFEGYGPATAPVIVVSDGTSANYARGHIGMIRSDAPTALAISNTARYFGRRIERHYKLEKLLDGALDVITKCPTGYNAGRLANPSTKMIVGIHIDLTGAAGNIVLSARARDSAGVISATQVNITTAVVVGYNRVELIIDNHENSCYVEVVRTGTSASDTAGNATLLSVEVASFENPIQSV